MAKTKADLKTEVVDIDSVSPDAANVRTHPDRNLASIKESLARFGQQKPIVVDADGVIRAGNGTWEAAKAMGWAKIAVVRTSLEGLEARAYAIADNRTTDLSQWDDPLLVDALQALSDEDGSLTLAAGFTEEEIQAMTEPPSAMDGDGQEAAASTKKKDVSVTHKCPECGFEWSGSHYQEETVTDE
jgi:ParB-like chromosome segregation protein Spo0J